MFKLPYTSYANAVFVEKVLRQSAVANPYWVRKKLNLCAFCSLFVARLNSIVMVAPDKNR